MTTRHESLAGIRLSHLPANIKTLILNDNKKAEKNYARGASLKEVIIKSP